MIERLIDDQAERDLLGWMILAGTSSQHIPVVLAECSAEMFGTETHRSIATAVLHLLEHRVPIDALEIVQELRRGGINTITIDYVTDLTTGIVFARPVTRRTSYLRELHHRRKLVAIADDLSVKACDLTVPLPDLFAELSAELTHG